MSAASQLLLLCTLVLGAAQVAESAHSRAASKVHAASSEVNATFPTVEQIFAKREIPQWFGLVCTEAKEAPPTKHIHRYTYCRHHLRSTYQHNLARAFHAWGDAEGVGNAWWSHPSRHRSLLGSAPARGEEGAAHRPQRMTRMLHAWRSASTEDEDEDDGDRDEAGSSSAAAAEPATSTTGMPAWPASSTQHGPWTGAWLEDWMARLLRDGIASSHAPPLSPQTSSGAARGRKLVAAVSSADGITEPVPSWLVFSVVLDPYLNHDSTRAFFIHTAALNVRYCRLYGCEYVAVRRADTVLNEEELARTKDDKRAGAWFKVWGGLAQPSTCVHGWMPS